jgi:DNA polymerase-1
MSDQPLNCRYLIVDGLNIFIRSWVCDPSISTRGNPVGGLVGFLKTLQKMLREMKPSRIVVVWDGAGGSKKRRAMSSDYKAGRKPIKLNRNIKNNLTPDQEHKNRIWQQTRLFEYLTTLPVYQFIFDGVEADDVIAYIAKIDTLQNCQKVIVSSDKDFIQLIDPKTVLFRPAQKEILNEKRVIERYGIHPSNFTLARAIAGDDKSDNIQGVDKVGLKTLANRFEAFGQEKELYVKDLFLMCEELSKGKKKLVAVENILSSRAVIEKNYQLVNLVPPKLSPSNGSSIRTGLTEQLKTLSKHNFIKMLISDGCGEWNFENLFSALQGMVSDDQRRS